MRCKVAEAGKIQETNKQQIIKELMELRNIGPKMAEKLYQTGIHYNELKGGIYPLNKFNY